MQHRARRVGEERRREAAAGWCARRVACKRLGKEEGKGTAHRKGKKTHKHSLGLNWAAWFKGRV